MILFNKLQGRKNVHALKEKERMIMRKSDNKTTKNSAKSGSNRTEKNCK